ncbi:THP3-like protein C2A9.11c [Exophiala dermatitidis]
MYSNSSAHGLPSWQAQPPYQTTQNAYIQVPARQTFSATAPLPPPPNYYPPPQYLPSPSPSTNTVAGPASSAQPAKKKMNWSPEVRDYVNRSFAQAAAVPGISKAEVEAKLRDIITEATQSGTLDTINWKEVPLPQQIILEERNRAVLAPVPPPSYVPFVPVAAPTPATNPPHPDAPRKRKSTEMSKDSVEGTAVPPWRANAQPLADRISFSSSDKRPKLDMSTSVSKTNASLESRRRRFEDSRAGSNSPRTQESSRGASPDAKMTGPIVGRSQKLEKNYFRLTSAPNPDDVRPLEVLRKTLELLKKKWRSDGNYAYICDQFKSLRQDLTVQHIKNEFTTSVYEYHARIALEKGDLGEYNQCQTQLRELYKQNLGGHPVEFKAYRILYFIHTCNQTDMNDVLSDLTPADKKEPAIKHALEVRSALALGNYHKFFKLYLTVPDMGAYLMDMFVERERLAALACLCKAYKPDVRLRFVTEELGFESDEEACQFILDHVPEESSPQLLEERDGDVRFLTGKVGSIFQIAKNRAFGQVDIKGQI